VRGPWVSTTSDPEGRYVELNEFLHCSGYANQMNLLIYYCGGKKIGKNIQFYTELQKIFLLFLLLL